MQEQQVLDDRYRLTEQLGVGGMSVVWKAHDELLNRSVAVKVLAGPHATSPAARQRVRAEARAAAQLWHPNVTDVYDYGEATTESGECVPYVVMELLPGRTLSQRLAAGPLPPRAALRICAEVADALAAAHGRGLVHRDVKPSNVMLTPSGAKVFDFGLAAIAGQAEIDEDGQLFGTPEYLAPERLIGGEVIPASDIYAFGLLIHRVLTNQLPWQADTTTRMLEAHLYIEPAPLPPTNGVLPEVNRMCDRCLAKDPADRPTAQEAAALLADAAGIVALPADDLPEQAAPASQLAEPADANPASIHPAATPQVRSLGTDAGHPRHRRTGALIAGISVLAIIVAAVALATSNAQSDGGTTAAAPPSSTASPVAPSVEPAGPAGPATSDPPPIPANPPPTITNGSRPVPTPTPTSTALPAEPGLPISAYGGIARVQCNGKKAQILRLDLTPGYTVDDYRPGPADEVKAVLVSATNKSEIKVRCDNGIHEVSIKETPQ